MIRAILIMAGFGAALLVTPADAQIIRDDRDKMVAQDATGPAGSYRGQPWWAPLSECTAVFAGKDEYQMRRFAVHAVQRLVTDRGMDPEPARLLLVPYIQGPARSRAQTMVAAKGQAAVERHCVSLFEQYRAL